jgi:hypothetical protein
MGSVGWSMKHLSVLALLLHLYCYHLPMKGNCDLRTIWQIVLKMEG